MLHDIYSFVVMEIISVCAHILHGPEYAQETVHVLSSYWGRHVNIHVQHFYESRISGNLPEVLDNARNAAKSFKRSVCSVYMALKHFAKASHAAGLTHSDGIKLSFKNVSYKVLSKDKKTELSLLTKVSGTVEPGEMCALMGASGAGTKKIYPQINT